MAANYITNDELLEVHTHIKEAIDAIDSFWPKDDPPALRTPKQNAEVTFREALKEVRKKLAEAEMWQNNTMKRTVRKLG